MTSVPQFKEWLDLRLPAYGKFLIMLFTAIGFADS